MLVTQLQKIWRKTNEHCHFCGDKLLFENYGKNKLNGGWNIDHIYPKAKGGGNTADNYLPVCGECNGLRWHRTGKEIQKLMRYGLIALREKKKNSEVGKKIAKLYKEQQRLNQLRRIKNTVAGFGS